MQVKGIFKSKEFIQNTTALVVVCTYSYMALVGDVEPKDFKDIVMMVVAFFFAAKAALAKPDTIKTGKK